MHVREAVQRWDELRPRRDPRRLSTRCRRPNREVGLGVGEVAVADLARDLPLVLQARLLTLRVRRNGRRGDVELRGNVLDDVAWNVTEISKERTDEADGRQLHGEAQPVVIATMTTDKTQIVVVEEEEALQLQPRRRAGRTRWPGHR